MLARAGKEISRLLYVNDLTRRLTFQDTQVIHFPTKGPHGLLILLF